MYSQYDHYTLENAIRNRQSDFMAEAAHQRMVDELKRVQQREVPSHHPKSPRYLVGETLLKIGGWLTGTPKLKEV